MKKRRSSKFGTAVLRIFNIRAWFDWDRMKALTVALKNGIKRMLVPQKTKVTESFEAAKKRMNLTDSEITTKKNALLRLSIIMLAAAIGLLGYSGYQLFFGSFKAFLVSIVITCIAMVLAFRYHFWYFQITHRKLGCTINEWYRQGLLGEKE